MSQRKDYYQLRNLNASCFHTNQTNSSGAEWYHSFCVTVGHAGRVAGFPAHVGILLVNFRRTGYSETAPRGGKGIQVGTTSVVMYFVAHMRRSDPVLIPSCHSI